MQYFTVLGLNKDYLEMSYLQYMQMLTHTEPQKEKKHSAVDTDFNQQRTLHTVHVFKQLIITGKFLKKLSLFGSEVSFQVKAELPQWKTLL